METRPIRLGLDPVPATRDEVAGGLCEWRGEACYRIDGYDQLDPFLTAIVSDCDLWMYAASTGGLTAGRSSPAHALFPYETVDRLFRSHPHTGPRTVVRVVEDDQTWAWEPFAEDGRLRYPLHRALYRHALGCELWFEERNDSLGLTFCYGWRPGRRLGWVRTAELRNDGSSPRRVQIIDGVQNLMPAGVETGLQDTFSCLVDAYRKTESAGGDLALYRLTSRIVDRAEASEMLRTTVAWRAGLPRAVTLLESSHGESFIRGIKPSPEAHLDGRPGSFLACDEFDLAAGSSASWHIVLDTNVDHAGVAAVEQTIAGDAPAAIDTDLRESRRRLRRFLSAADAFQATGDPIADAHHTSNVLFNIARGGVLPQHYLVERDDLARSIGARNRAVAARHTAWLAGLPVRLPLSELHTLSVATGDPHLARCCREYLPLVFSRRHGDPSRPWNRFTIAVDDPDGSLRHAYEGNWRDIFQNWEALCRSFPECIEPMIAKFVNASTMDGFNPYRITHEGIDWEVPDPAHPWSSIGYWGDHQIVYLLRLLEMSMAHHPGRLSAMLGERVFTYADVPYDIRPYADIVANPQKTIVFDAERDRAAMARVTAVGTDGRLVHGNGEPLRVTMAEKLLVPILAKVSNLVPEGGVWMNTMRPEWNDANNALVGNGISVVTACHLYQHLEFCANLFDSIAGQHVEISEHAVRWLADITTVVDHHAGKATNDHRRRAFMDACGNAFSQYRAQAYACGPGEPVQVATSSISAFLRRAHTLVGDTLAANRRPDGLYHAYNLLHLKDGAAAVSRLPLMLEGQVAVLGSGLFGPAEAVELLDALRASELYRADQRSYLLYPEKQLPSFVAMNRAPEWILERAPALAARMAAGDRHILVRDGGGMLRFHADLHNAEALLERLDDMLPAAERAAVLEAYESVFNHKAFTGRSGAMYRYEGIGCIYWHMVAKLALAAREALHHAIRTGADRTLTAALRRHAEELRSGLGFAKSPAEFGAFPLDAYSHTPAFGGASQPGMTGQVKEEILARWLELGVRVENGRLVLEPSDVHPREFASRSRDFHWMDSDDVEHTLPLGPGEIAFTYCQVPIVYTPAGGQSIVVLLADGHERRVAGTSLPVDLSAKVFAHTGEIARVTVHFDPGCGTIPPA